MPVEVVIEDDRWTALGLDRIAATAAAAVLDQLHLDAEDAEISVLGTDDTRIARLNGDFRGKPKPTNVLSWPSQDLSPELPGATPARPAADAMGELSLGDIALAYDICSHEAVQASKPMRDHALHLLVHGLLHLLGYDHETEADAARMENLEVQILAGLGLDNPYILDAGTTGSEVG